MRRLSVALAFVAMIPSAAPTAAQQTVLLRFSPPVGQVTRYRNVAQTWMQIPGLNVGDTSQPAMSQTMYWTRTITDEHSNTWTANTVIDSSSFGPMSRGDMFRGTVIRQTYDATGRLDSSSVTPPPGADSLMVRGIRLSGHVLGSLPSNLSMPSRPLRVGDSWTDTVSVPLTTPRGNMTLKGQVIVMLEHLERVGGDRVAVISSAGDFATDTSGVAAVGKASLHSTVRLDVDAGRMLSAITDQSTEIITPVGLVRGRIHSETVLLP